MLIFRERDHAVAQVSGRKHVEVFAEASAGAAVIGHGYNGCQITNRMGRIAGNTTAVAEGT